MTNTALIQVLGAVAYGELKAYDGAKADAAAATDEHVRLHFRKVAAEELRHHKGFVSCLERMGADPERAMRPYRAVLDRYHSKDAGDDVEGRVVAFLGEGVADDLLQWLRQVVDDDTAAFIDTVIEDEVEHEEFAAAALREQLVATRGGRRRAGRATRQMVVHMLLSGGTAAAPMTAFLRIGRPGNLLGALAGGHVRRMREIGLGPMGSPILSRG
jgi:DNA-binding ferritin-like protein (Dps family)